MNTLGQGRVVTVATRGVVAVVEHRNSGTPDPNDLYQIMNGANEERAFSGWEEILQLDGGDNGEYYYVAAVSYEFDEFPEFRSMTFEEARVDITNRLSKLVNNIEVRFIGTE